MDHAKWIHCYDPGGKRRPIEEIPTTFEKLKDDPYRSLARDVQRRGGFAKPEEPVRISMGQLLSRSHRRSAEKGNLA
jgi:hypothetical protein